MLQDSKEIVDTDDIDQSIGQQVSDITNIWKTD